LCQIIILAAEPLYVPPVVDTTTPGEPAAGNVLDNAELPTGTTASVTGFSVPGTDTIYPAGSTVPLVDPITGLVTGTISVNPDGSYIFTPAPGYVGGVPPVTVSVASTDGQTVQVPLTVAVNPVLVDASENLAVTAGTGPLTTNVLDNAVVPPGTTATVTSFSLPGSSVVYPAGPTPVTVIDPVSGKVAGTVVVQPDGTVTFSPAPGFTGQAPAFLYTVESSDGQVSPGALSVTVLPGEGHTVTRVRVPANDINQYPTRPQLHQGSTSWQRAKDPASAMPMITPSTSM
jgi:hypothetical protein